MKKRINLQNVNYEKVFNSFYNDEFIPTNNLVLTIAYYIKYNKISSSEVYKMIDEFYKKREYNYDGTYLDFTLLHMKDNKILEK